MTQIKNLERKKQTKGPTVRSLFAAAACFIGSVGPIHAEEGKVPESAGINQDVPVTWNGAYVGLTANRSGLDGTYRSFDLDRTAALDYLHSGSASGNGLALVSGYNWQTGLLVYGVELSASNPNAAITHVENYAPPESFAYSQNLSSLASFTGRVGYAFGQTLVYGTAGIAYGKVAISGYDTFVDPAGGSISSWQRGWVYGVGVAQMLGGGWSASLEYRQVSLDTLTYDPDYWYKPFRDSHTLEHREVSVGIKYHF